MSKGGLPGIRGSFFHPEKWVAGTKNAKNCGVFFSVEPMKTLLNRMCWQDMSFSVCSPVRSSRNAIRSEKLKQQESAVLSVPLGLEAKFLNTLNWETRT